MSIGQSVTPNENAELLAENIIDAESVQREVLTETIHSAENGVIRESGRTICPSVSERIKGPLARFPKSVDLQLCPADGLTGVVHTHVTPDEMQHPGHSLPDMANVVFEGADASVIVGTESSDIFVTGTDTDAMESLFQDALGVRATSTQDVVTAFERGEIPDPESARDRVRSRLGTLFRTARTPHPQLTRRVRELFSESQMVAAGPALQRGYDVRAHGTKPKTRWGHHARTLRGKFRSGRNIATQTKSNSRLKGVVIATVVGNVIGILTNRTLRFLTQPTE